MSAVLLQTSAFSQSIDSGTSQAFTFEFGAPAGSTVVVPFVSFPGGAVIGVSDNQGNSYTLAAGIYDSLNSADIWYCSNITSDSTVPLIVTATFSASGNYNTGRAQVWSGLGGLDKTGESTQSNTVAVSEANSQAEVVAFVCMVATDGVSDAGLGFASDGWTTIWRENNSNDTQGGQSGYRIVSALEATSVTASTGAIYNHLSSVIATFLVAPSSVGSGVSGSSAVTLASVTLQAAGAVKLQGQLSQTLEGASLVSAGKLKLNSRLARDLDSVSLVGVGRVRATGHVSINLDDVALLALGSHHVLVPVISTGELTSKLEPVALVSSGLLATKGSVIAVLDSTSLSAGGKLSLAGRATASLQGVSLTATGAALFPTAQFPPKERTFVMPAVSRTYSMRVDSQGANK